MTKIKSLTSFILALILLLTPCLVDVEAEQGGIRSRNLGLTVAYRDKDVRAGSWRTLDSFWNAGELMDRILCVFVACFFLLDVSSQFSRHINTVSRCHRGVYAAQRCQNPYSLRFLEIYQRPPNPNFGWTQ